MMNNVNILGIADVTHDASVCLSQNGKILCAIEEERITRVKHGLKRDSSSYRLHDQGKYIFDLLEKQTVHVREKKHKLLIDYCLNAAQMNEKDIDFSVTSTLYNEWPFRFDGVFLQHHVAHAASAFYPSSFDKAAVLVIEGYGVVTNERSECGMIGLGNNQKLEILDYYDGFWSLTPEEKEQKIYNPHMVFQNSLGVFYQNITMLLGLGYYNEGKTMGLSSYGHPDKSLNILDQFVNLLPNGKVELDNRSIFLVCEQLVQQYANYDKNKKFQAYANLAYKHQDLLNKMVIHIANHCYKLTKQENLCLAGGVIMNCVANTEIMKNTPFKNVFVQPAAGDNGISVGCALYGAHTLAGLPRFYNDTNKFSVYLGKNYNKSEIEQALVEFSPHITEIITSETPCEYVARAISEGKIIAWFKGGSEFGARALGNRSILADPRSSTHKQYLNEVIKHRENFRPFAPAVIEEKTSLFFDAATLSPHMTFIVDVKSEYRAKLPAITHVDGSARLQTVTKEQNEEFYNLLLAFEKITGYPILLNTSFNDAGQPIIETPREAIQSFLDSDLDLLVMNGMIFRLTHSKRKLEKMALVEPQENLETVVCA